MEAYVILIGKKRGVSLLYKNWRSEFMEVIEAKTRNAIADAVVGYLKGRMLINQRLISARGNGINFDEFMNSADELYDKIDGIGEILSGERKKLEANKRNHTIKQICDIDYQIDICNMELKGLRQDIEASMTKEEARGDRAYK